LIAISESKFEEGFCSGNMKRGHKKKEENKNVLLLSKE
jgi:hypothetical protein